jgi:lipopolysaccharide biosynthesis glycosyltransferase
VTNPKSGSRTVTTPVHVACSTDEPYVPHLAVMLKSLLSNGNRGATISLLHGGDVAADSIAKLREMVVAAAGTLDVIPVTRATGGAASTGAHWHRLLAPELLPDLSRVIYLDSDLLVLDSLRELWESDLRGNHIGAVTNVFALEHLDRLEVRQLDSPGAYFNSGVMLMDLQRMRRDGLVERLVRQAAEGRQTDWFEQDALNVVLSCSRLPLHPRWNCMNSFFLYPWAAHVFGTDVVRAACDLPAIRHFEGPGSNKPWHMLCDRPGHERYADYRSQTAWRTWTPLGSTLGNRFRRLARQIRKLPIGR